MEFRLSSRFRPRRGANPCAGLIALWLALGVLFAAVSLSAGLAVSAAVAAASEECTEESDANAGARTVSQQSTRLRVRCVTDAQFVPVEFTTADRIGRLPPHPPGVPRSNAHLIGSGINLVC